VPSRATALGAGLELRQGSWSDSPADSAYIAPTRAQLYDELDRFHVPPRADSTWGEWQYYNVVIAPDEWWYVTYLVGGEVGLPAAGSGARWGGRMLLTHRRPDGRYERYAATAPSASVRFDTTRADLTIGPSTVRQRDGLYTLHVRATGPDGQVRMDLRVRPLPNRYFPPVELREHEFLSGYVVPGLAARASGTICLDRRCTGVVDAAAYHDHNWGVWRDVTWEWGASQGATLSLLYGGVYGPEQHGAGSTVSSPLFLAVVDSLGVRQVLRFSHITYEGGQRAAGASGNVAPRRFSLVAGRGADTLTVTADVEEALATGMSAASFQRYFLQMRGRAVLRGRLAGQPVSDTGQGFFETYRSR
jgi:hypothetical protein